jgi:hypothetical protein
MISTEFFEKVEQILENYPRNHSVNSLRNAFDSLSRAKKIQDIDANMAYFLALTAEEEAVSAIFLALKQLGYNGALQVSHRNHIHKTAFYPFCQAVYSSFSIFKNCNPQIVIDKKSPNHRLFIKFFVQETNKESYVATPDVPFGFSIKSDDSFENFESNLKKYFGDDYLELNKWLSNAANRRNKILYASPIGIPKVESKNLNNFIEKQQGKIKNLMLLYFLIAPYTEKQVFIQQALHAFIKMIGKIPNEDKLLELIENIDEAPIGCTVDLNTGNIKNIEIDSSVVDKLPFCVQEDEENHL